VSTHRGCKSPEALARHGPSPAARGQGPSPWGARTCCTAWRSDCRPSRICSTCSDSSVTACRSLSRVSVLLASPGPRGTVSRPFSANRRTSHQPAPGRGDGPARGPLPQLAQTAVAWRDLTPAAATSSLAPAAEFCPNRQGVSGTLPGAFPSGSCSLCLSSRHGSAPGRSFLGPLSGPLTALCPPQGRSNISLLHTHNRRITDQKLGREPGPRRRRADRRGPSRVPGGLPTAGAGLPHRTAPPSRVG